MKRSIRKLLRRLGIDIVRFNNQYPIFKPVDPFNVEILADISFQNSVLEVSDLTLLDSARLANLWVLCQCADPLGAILEVGSYKGGGALHLSNSCPGRKIIACDPFSSESFEKVDPKLDRYYWKGQFSGVSRESVENLLKSHGRDYEVIQGYFPQSVVGKELPAVSFVHLDVDVYSAARECLDFLFNNAVMLDRSYIVIDDYNRSANGLNKAVEEILSTDKGWTAIPLFPGQCLLVRTRSC